MENFLTVLLQALGAVLGVFAACVLIALAIGTFVPSDFDPDDL